MEAVWSRCAGLDIGKKFLVACVLVEERERKVRKEIRTFGSTTRDLLALRDWLKEQECEAVAMESTGPYWKPIWNVLEDEGMALVLANPQHMKAVPGRKSDVKDAEWIADLLRHGLIAASYVPSREQRELRELVRYRRSIIEERAREVNRLQKVLEGANIKLGSVLSDVTGKTGSAILQGLAQGEEDPGALADRTVGRVKVSREDLMQSLTGYMKPHQRYMLQRELDHIRYLNGVIADLDAQIAQRLEPVKQVSERLRTIPGVGPRTAEVILAEAGADASHFPSATHFAAWAGLAPGQNESAGKRKPGRTRQGNRSLRSAMVEAARAAARTKTTYLAAQHTRLSKRLKGKKATVAVAHSLIVMVYHILANPTEVYRELGHDHFHRKDADAARRRAVDQLRSLGYEVALTPVSAA